MRVAFLTAGGIAPCLSASIGALIKGYLKSGKDFEFIGYLNGYKGLLKGNKIDISKDINFTTLNTFGGSFLGNSRIKLTNVDDCIKNNYIKKGEIPLEVAANQLKKESGWEHVHANCSGCHSLQLVTSNRGDRMVWLNLIRWMQKEHNLWEIQPESEEIILSYLSVHYSSTLPMRRRPLAKDQMP